MHNILWLGGFDCTVWKGKKNASTVLAGVIGWFSPPETLMGKLLPERRIPKEGGLTPLP